LRARAYKHTHTHTQAQFWSERFSTWRSA
jgi:hypothetical protein